MAKILENAAYMALPLSIKRGNPAPIDTTAVWYDKAAMQAYAQSGATAYVGQLLSLVTQDGLEAYLIADTAGTLLPLTGMIQSVEELPENPDPNVLYLIRDEDGG